MLMLLFYDDDDNDDDKDVDDDNGDHNAFDDVLENKSNSPTFSYMWSIIHNEYNESV